LADVKETQGVHDAREITDEFKLLPIPLRKHEVDRGEWSRRRLVRVRSNPSHPPHFASSGVSAADDVTVAIFDRGVKRLHRRRLGVTQAAGTLPHSTTKVLRLHATHQGALQHAIPHTIERITPVHNGAIDGSDHVT